MTCIRLFNCTNKLLQSYKQSHTPPYLAVSHAWSDYLFPCDADFSLSPGGIAVEKVISTFFDNIEHSWVDNICIRQDDDHDKIVQLPLMGSIYREADAVIVILGCELGLTQQEVDSVSQNVEEAVALWQDDTWTELPSIQYWQQGRGRKNLVRAMKMPSKFTKSTWATRIWTLQEYVLASKIVWIGTDLQPITIDDRLFQAIPGLCEAYEIPECLARLPGSEYYVLYSHLVGMVNFHLGSNDKTRVMELLGNRKATVSVDEVYGIMAASTVEITPKSGESKEKAWERWCEAAVSKGHLRWAMLPHACSTTSSSIQETNPNCVIPRFLRRHEVSSGSMLDSVTGFKPPSVTEGTVILAGRNVGRCRLLRKLGSSYEFSTGLIDRGLTLVLFSRGRWSHALKIALAFGAGRYSGAQLIAIAQILTNNYAKLCHCLHHGSENRWSPIMPTSFHETVWQDFMQLLSRSVMDPLNVGVGYLARISSADPGVSFLTVVVTGGRKPTGRLEAIDVNAVTNDNRRVLMIVEHPSPGKVESEIRPSALHKAGTTLPISDDFDSIWDQQELNEYVVGGSRCRVCKSTHSFEPHNTQQWQERLKDNAMQKLTKENARKLVRRDLLVNRQIANHQGGSLGHTKSKAHPRRKIRKMRSRIDILTNLC